HDALPISVHNRVFALHRIVADVAQVKIVHASLRPGSDGHVFPVHSVCAEDEPDSAMLPAAVKCVDERSISAVVVSPKQIWVAPRGCNSAALSDRLVLQGGKMGRGVLGGCAGLMGGGD